MSDVTVLLMLRHRTKVSTIRVPRSVAYDEAGEGAILSSFASACGVKVGDVLFDTLHPDQCINGIYYDWGLANANGGWFDLFQLPYNTKPDLDACKMKLRRNQDVVVMRTHQLGPWVNFTVSLPDGTVLRSDTGGEET